jgi:ABC-type sugar transport system permease subunit
MAVYNLLQRRTQVGREYLTGYLLILPAFVLFAIFVLAPIGYGAYISLTDWDGFSPMSFVGLANFEEAAQDPIFQQAILHNVIFAIAVVIAKNALGLFLGVLLNCRLRGLTFFRTAMFLPVTMSFVVIGLLWSWIYNPEFGLLNSGLSAVHLPGLAHNWLGDASLALWAVIFVDIWKWTGFHTVIFLAGLQGIPAELSEAGLIDGANRWQAFWHITWPLLKPVTMVSVLLSLMGAFVQNFDLVYVMTAGGPDHATEVALTLIYSDAFGTMQFGYASALGYILFAIVFVISMVQIRVMRSERYEY